MADANPPVVKNTKPAKQEPQTTSASELEKFKTELPNGLTIHNFVATA